MRTIVSISIISVLMGIVYPSLGFGDTIDEEILALFKSGIITIPEGKDTCSLEEISAPSEVLSVLQAINALLFYKGFPDFKSEDTLRISTDGWPA